MSTKESLSIDQMSEKLVLSIVCFSYTVADGSTREAIGTLNAGIIPDKYKQEKDKIFDLVCRIPERVSVDEITKELEGTLATLRQKQSQGPKSKEKSGNIAYYDLQKKAFRSFVFEKLVGIRYVYPIE